MPRSWSQTLSGWREDIYFIISNCKCNEKLVEITKGAEGFSSSDVFQSSVVALLNFSFLQGSDLYLMHRKRVMQRQIA